VWMVSGRVVNVSGASLRIDSSDVSVTGSREYCE
jgi:hypothetical protein